MDFMISLAQTQVDSPDEATVEVMGALQKLSASSESTSQTQLLQDDGSVLVVTSVQGGDATLEALAQGDPRVTVWPDADPDQ